MSKFNKRKILIINTIEFVMGGISSVIMNYFENMDTDKIQMDFVVNKKIEFCFEKKIRDNHSKLYVLNRNKNPIKYMNQLTRIIKDNHYDVVHVHGNSATMLVDLLPAMLSGVTVRIAHSHNTECSHTVIHKLLSPIFMRTYTNALACSEDAGDWIFGKDNFQILLNGIDVDKYTFSEHTRNEVRRELKLDGKFVIGHVGFMNEQKNHPMLFKILAEVKKKIPTAILLCVTGNDEVPDNLKQMIEEYSLQKNVVVLYKRNDVNRLLQAMDIFMFPSKWEGLGIALIEAQSSGLPCIASDKVTKESNITGCVKYYSLDNEKIWCDFIESIYNNHQVQANRSEICKKSQKLIKEAGYDVKTNANSICLMYEKYCKGE